MLSPDVIKQIRESERNSHIRMYTKSVLYEDKGWLQKPVKTVMDLLPLFKDCMELKVLDLGCGVGRNSICIAKYYEHQSCLIDCVDILELAIEKLTEYAKIYQVSSCIRGIVAPVEEFPIPQNHYNWIISVSTLEHLESKNVFLQKLVEIRNGVQKNGIVCFIINTDITEHCKSTGIQKTPQFEINLTCQEMEIILFNTFSGWNILKSTRQRQIYDIPRGDDIHTLNTTVITFVAQRTDM